MPFKEPKPLLVDRVISFSVWLGLFFSIVTIGILVFLFTR